MKEKTCGDLLSLYFSLQLCRPVSQASECGASVRACPRMRLLPRLAIRMGSNEAVMTKHSVTLIASLVAGRGIVLTTTSFFVTVVSSNMERVRSGNETPTQICSSSCPSDRSTMCNRDQSHDPRQAMI